jgi:tripeptidyl-peptidase-1
MTDLKRFWKLYSPGLDITVKVVGVNKGAPTAEASLDIEYLTSLGNGAPSEFWGFAGTAPHDPENEPFLDFILKVASTSDADVPKVFSTSYGECEYEVDPAYMGRIEIEFQKAAARGITLLFATGDEGVGVGEPKCPGDKFCQQWPAASPWVTAVGGTDFKVHSVHSEGKKIVEKHALYLRASYHRIFIVSSS